jgi:putative salt-induced outer membrane protein
VLLNAVAMGTAAAQTPAPAAEVPPTWTGTAGAGISLTSGNSDTTNYTLSFDVTRDPKTRNVMKAAGLYLRGSQDGEATVNRLSLGFKDQYALTSRLYVFGQLDYLRDEFKAIDYLLAPTGGIGYKVADSDELKFSVDAGAGVVIEKNPGLDARTNGAVTAGEKLEYSVTPTATIKHAATALWTADDFGDGLYTVSVGLATKLSEVLQLSIELLDTYKNRPPSPGIEKNDVAFVTAIAARF